MDVVAHVAGANAKATCEQTLAANAGLLTHDHVQFPSILQNTLADLDNPASIYGQMPAAARTELKVDATQKLAIAAFDGWARENPAAALASLRSGYWDKFLGGHEDVLEQHALMLENRQALAAEAADRAALKAEEAASKKTEDSYIGAVYGASRRIRTS